MAHIDLYTDGACRGNPGPGGWGALLRWNGHEKELSGGEPNTTNNRMEIMAVIKGLEALKNPAQKVTIHTDSKYVKDGATQWMHGWKAKGWKKSGGPIKNLDLWQHLDKLLQVHDTKWIWIKGHAGHPENERVDALATAAADTYN